MERNIIARKPGRNAPGYEKNNIVLAQVEGYQPFVTWIEVTPDDRETFYVNGHYYTNRADAEADYTDRT